MRVLTSICIFILGTFIFCATVSGQATEFTYQGRLLDNSMAPTANYDFEFRLFTVDTGGSALGTLQRLNVQVSSGIFTVRLDFGAQFDGAARYLEIGVRPAGGGGFTTLLPRQPIESAPYNIRSLSSAIADSALNSLQLGGIAASQYVLTTDPRMTDARDPLAGSSNYVQNSTSPQAVTNFNISGTGTANVFNAGTQYDIGGNRALIATSTITFVGLGAGTNNTLSAISNSFFGTSAGSANTTGRFNSFFGTNAGFSNTTGASNSFFGTAAGPLNTTGSNNSFFGYGAGDQNTIGTGNSFFGSSTGSATTSGSYNSFFGYNAGAANTTAINNSFFGQGAGFRNTTGQDLTFIGNGAGQNNTTANGNTFVGSLAGLSNTTAIQNAFFGAYAGQNNSGDINSGTGSFNSFFGIYAGNTNTTGGANSFFGSAAGTSNTTGSFNAFFGQASGFYNTTGTTNAFFGDNSGNKNTTASDNSFFGEFAGYSTTTGGQNSFFGRAAGASNATGFNNAFFGWQAGEGNTIGQQNAFFGDAAGQNNTTACCNAFFGSGAGFNNVGVANTFLGFQTGLSNDLGNNNTLIGDSANVGSGGLNFATAIGAGAVVSSSNTVVLGRSDGSDIVDVPGKLQIDTLGTAGNTQLCLNASNRVSPCSSSLRYKTEVAPFRSGLDLANRLRPIAFTWKDGGMRDVGLGAEDVAAIEPRLVTYDRNGQVEGVKYDRITIVLLNAVREQQAQIDTQQKEIESQRILIDGLKKLLCAREPEATVCQEEK